jgi:uncharacterized membrane protein
MDITPSSSSHAHLSASQGASLHNPFAAIQAYFPKFKHDHPPVMDVNKVADEQLTVGDRIADAVASTVGSWPFIIVQSIILAAWIVANIILAIYHSAWDPYPFILLNLALSFQAAYAAPFVMMSQNRQAAKDRLMAENDYKTDVKGEIEICNIMEHLDHQDKLILQLIERVDAQHQQILLLLSQMDPEMARGLHSNLDALTGEEAE